VARRAVGFLGAALVAAALGFGEFAGGAATPLKVLALVFLTAAVVAWVTSRALPAPAVATPRPGGSP